MIKVIFNRSYQREQYLIAVRKCVTEEVFLERAKVRSNSYAGRLASHLYQDIFVRSLNIKRDFALYYEVEYEEFGEYLRKRYLLDRDDASDLSTAYAGSEAIYYYKRPYSFLREGVGEELFSKLLRAESA